MLRREMSMLVKVGNRSFIRLSLWSVSALYLYLYLGNQAPRLTKACTTEPLPHYPSMKMTKPRFFSSPVSLSPRCRPQNQRESGRRRNLLQDTESYICTWSLLLPRSSQITVQITRFSPKTEYIIDIPLICPYNSIGEVFQ